MVSYQKMRFLLPIFILLSIAIPYSMAGACGAFPSGAIGCASANVINNAAGATGANFIQEFTINTIKYSAYLAGSLQNAQIYNDISGGIYNCWIKGNSANLQSTTLNALANVLIDCNIPESIAGSGTDNNIYIAFFPLSTNNFNALGNWGENPLISTAYGQYDNGNVVFPTSQGMYYTDFEGTSLASSWSTFGSGLTTSQANGVTLSTSTGSYSGIYNSNAVTTSQIVEDYGFISTNQYYLMGQYTGATAEYGASSSGKFDIADSASGSVSSRPCSAGGTSYATATNQLVTFYDTASSQIVYLNYAIAASCSSASANAAGAISLGIQASSGTTKETLYFLNTQPNAPSNSMPAILQGAFTSAVATTISVSPSSPVALPANTATVTATCIPSTDTCDVDSPLGTHLCTGTGTCSYAQTVNVIINPSQTFYANDLTQSSISSGLTYQSYVPWYVTNSVGTFTIPALTSTISGNYFYPIDITTLSPNSQITFTLTNTIGSGGALTLQSNVANVAYIPPSTQATANELFTLTEFEYSNTIVLTDSYNVLNMTDVNAPFTFCSPSIQYFPNAALSNSITWTAKPTQWKIIGDKSQNTYWNQTNGNYLIDVWSDANTVFNTANGFSVILNYGFTSFTANLVNNFRMSTSNTQIPFNAYGTNSISPPSPIAREVANVPNFNERTYGSIQANSTFLASVLVNNYSINTWSAAWTWNNFYVYTENSNYANPPLFLSNITVTSTEAGYINANNYYCSTTVNNGQYVTYNPYLVETANGAGYTFQLTTGGGYLPPGYYMVTQEFNGIGFVQVGSTKIAANPFSYPLLTGNEQYRFLFFNPSCTSQVYNSPSGVWVSPIQLTIPTSSTPTVSYNTTNAIAKCSTYTLTGNTYINCFGTDTRNFVNGWTITLSNITTVYQIYNIVQTANFNGASFSWNSIALNPGSAYYVNIVAHVGLTADPSVPILQWFTNTGSSYITPFASGGALIAILVYFTLIFIGGELDWTLFIGFSDLALFLLVIFNILPLPGLFFYAIIFISAVILGMFEVAKL